MSRLRLMYPTLHEADISKAVDILNDKLNGQTALKSLKYLRIRRNLTQQEVADLANMSLTQYQYYEYGNRKIENMTLKTAMGLAGALGVGVEELFYIKH